MAIKVVCAWCGITIQDGQLDKDGRVSHGMCKKCADRVAKDIEKGRKK